MSYIGYCEEENLPIKSGDTVIIPKGIKVKTMNPSKKEYITKRTMKIKVHHTLPGSTWGGNPKSNPSIVWAGMGNYWCEVDINDIVEG
jgi:hypothetical protein